MFKSRRAAILADGGLFDSVAVWRQAEVGCSVSLLTVHSNNKSVQKVRDLFRFQKDQFVVVYRKKDERCCVHVPDLFKLNKINNPRSKC